MKPLIRKKLIKRSISWEGRFFCDHAGNPLICTSILARRFPWVKDVRTIVVELYPANYPDGTTIRFKSESDHYGTRRVKYSISERSSIRGVLSCYLEDELEHLGLVNKNGETAKYKLVVV